MGRVQSSRNVLMLSSHHIKGLTLEEREEEQRRYEEEADIDFFLVQMELGEGPMRFAGKGEHSIERQLRKLSDNDYRAFRKIKRQWERGGQNVPFPDSMYLRFLRNTIPTGKEGFQERRAWKALTKFNVRYHKMRIANLEGQILSKTLFPVPGLKTRDGHDMFYMRPARYIPKETPTRVVIDNLIYVMNTMLEKERACRDGIGFLACMDDWKMKNFDVEYCFQFMMGLQGRLAPVTVTYFLIVNPPSWFGVIWKIMKGMLTPSFRKKVKMIPQSQLDKYLQPGYKEYLPDDMVGLGKANTEEMVRDFVEYRTYLDEQDHDGTEGTSLRHSTMSSVSGSGSSRNGGDNVFGRDVSCMESISDGSGDELRVSGDLDSMEGLSFAEDDFSLYGSDSCEDLLIGMEGLDIVDEGIEKL